jgi:phage gp29-like protein
MSFLSAFAKKPETKPSITSIAIPQSTFNVRALLEPDTILNARNMLIMGRYSPMLKAYATFLDEDDAGASAADVRSEALKSASVAFSSPGISQAQIDYFNAILDRFGVILMDMLLEYKFAGVLFRQINYEFANGLYYPVSYTSYPHADLRLHNNHITAFNGSKPLELSPIKFIALHRNKAVLYSVIKYNVFFTFALNNWGQFCETFGKPPRIAKYKPGTTDSEKNELWAMLQNFGTDLAAMVSDNVVIDFADFVNKSGSADLFRTLCDFCDDRITRRILGNTLTTKAVGDGGSYAQAKVHNLVRGDILAGDCRDLDAFLSQHFTQLNNINFGPGKIKVKVNPAKDVNLLERIQVDSKLYNEIGLDFPDNYWYDTYGIPQPAKA